MIDDKEMEEFFHSLKNTDKDMMVIEEFRHRVKMVQNRFSENE